MEAEALPPPRDFSGALARVADEAIEPEPALLGQLSGPSRAELNEWRAVWPTLGVARRRWILNGMAELTEDDFAVHFVPQFELALTDPDAEVRRAALDGLWESEDVRLLEPILNLLQSDGDAGVRGRAATALTPLVQRAEMEELAAVDARRLERALVDAAADETEDPDVRRRATEAVGYLDTPGVRALIETHAESGERLLHAGALVAMGRNARAQWEPYIIDSLASADSILAFAATHAAGDLGEESLVPYVWPLAEGDDIDLQIEAIWALGEIGGRQARRALESLAESTDDDDVQQAVDDALAMVALADEDDLLGLMGFDPAASDLVEVTDDEPWLADDVADEDEVDDDDLAGAW